MPVVPIGNLQEQKQLMGKIGYSTLPGRRDESVAADGSILPHWEPLFESVGRHGSGVLVDWRNVANRISRERGLAYRPASLDESDPAEGWSLDPIPWLYSAKNWEVLDEGISQRTRLYEALLTDAYGEQRMLQDKIVPAEILLGHPGFVRALHDLTPGDTVVGLGISAFDVARDASGQPFVVNDRFDHPFGLGLALENRTVVNKVLPRLFRRCGVRRVGQFFTDWFDYLTRRAQSGAENPLIAIVDASGEDEDSEIGFLANYCGILRVHPSDLTVRGGKVWIKALRKLVPVDVIWKTMPGAEMDSLESEMRGKPGIPGLFEAMRIGGVTLASHPGSAVMQSPGLYPFLPKLCREFLGEELKIPPVASWWCGDPAALSHVLANLSSMVIKSVNSHANFQTRYGRRASVEELDELKRTIQANPTRFVGQEEIQISTIPTSRRDKLVPHGSVLRMFSFYDNEKGPSVMPGGLARVSTDDGIVVSTREEGDSKDVWVCSTEAPEPFSIASVVDTSLPAAPYIVPSRTGENLYWTGRYAERAQFIARFSSRIIDGRVRGYSHDEAFEKQHEDLLMEAFYSVFEYDPSGMISPEGDPLDDLLRDPACSIGIPYNLQRFHNASQVTRESWSPASIMAIESCHTGWRRASALPQSHFGFSAELDTLQLNLAAFLGLNLDSMTRDEGWALLDIGRRIERGTLVGGLLTFLLKSEHEGDMSMLLNESVLYILDSVRTYQRRFHKTPNTPMTTLLLLSEPDYPRSLHHLLDRLIDIGGKLPNPKKQEHPLSLLDPMSRKLEGFVGPFIAEVEAGLFQKEEALNIVTEMADTFIDLSDYLTVTYFNHANR
ncbi:MAG: circularly permuted type 2 ATP-grasp protein [Verrucomicrobiales bacterium]|nr:circularly permuted type 2 ATP-grasp protein [Verrucomicrobiales bacterium]